MALVQVALKCARTEICRRSRRSGVMDRSAIVTQSTAHELVRKVRYLSLVVFERSIEVDTGSTGNRNQWKSVIGADADVEWTNWQGFHNK